MLVASPDVGRVPDRSASYQKVCVGAPARRAVETVFLMGQAVTKRTDAYPGNIPGAGVSPHARDQSLPATRQLGVLAGCHAESPHGAGRLWRQQRIPARKANP